MFERFSDEARGVVVRAQQEARALGHGWIGTEHLLVAALADIDSPVARALGRLGLTADAVRARVLQEVGPGPGDDDAALRDLGIDLDVVRRRVEERFGPGALDRAGPAPGGRRRRLRRRRHACTEGERGHIPFTPRAKKALELSLREALTHRRKEIRLADVVLGVMRTDGLAAGVVTRLGVPPDAVRRAVLDLDRAA